MPSKRKGTSSTRRAKTAEQKKLQILYVQRSNARRSGKNPDELYPLPSTATSRPKGRGARRSRGSKRTAASGVSVTPQTPQTPQTPEEFLSAVFGVADILLPFDPPTRAIVLKAALRAVSLLDAGYDKRRFARRA